MPRMPDKNTLAAPGSFRSGRSYPTAGDADFSAVGRGLEAAGAGLMAGATAVRAGEEKSRNEQNALDLIKAEATQRRGLFEAERALDEDGDYATHDKRYTPAATDITNKAAELIRDPQKREMWRMRADNDIIAGRERLTRRADQYGKQDRLVQLEGTLEGYRNTFTDPKATEDQRRQLLTDIQNTIELGKRGGILTPVAAQKLTEDYLRGAIKQDAERRLLDDPDGLRRDLMGGGAEGELEPGNIDLSKRPVVRNEDGSASTIKSIPINENGREVLIPTIDPDGKELTEEEAIERYLGSGEHLGKFDTAERATGFAKKLSERQAKAFLPHKGSSPEAISIRLETGKTDPSEGVKNISADSNGSRSYGNFGLNSQRGGSAHQFAKEYGSTLGLSGKPGTAEFDRSWRAVAAADPKGLHRAEMAWYQKNILEPTRDDLKGAGVPDELAGDPRVLAYFADRKIQQGPGSIDGMDKHAKRIRAAADRANGSVESFLNRITEADRAALEDDFPSAIRSGVYGPKGHNSRIYGRLKMALGMGSEQGSEEAGRYGALTPLERSEFLSKAERSVRSRFEGQREQLKQQLDDDVESVRRTGISADPDLETARRVLEPNQVNRYFLQRQEAAMEYRATSDLHSLPEAELNQRLESIAPKPGEAFYEMKAKVFDKAKKRADDLREQRDVDPARSVTDFPEVKEAARAAGEAPDDPGAIQALARARLDAQAKIGVPESQRSPITKAEARVLMAPVKGLEGKSLVEAMVSVNGKLEQLYGPYARAVGVAAVEQIVHNRELAEAVETQINRAFNGLPASSAQQRRVEYLTESAQASRAFGGQYVGEPMLQFGQRPGDDVPAAQFQGDPFANYQGKRPSERAVQALIGNPALASEFNAKFGPGAAELILSQPR